MTFAEYEAAAQAFRDALHAEMQKPSTERVWPEEWLTVRARVVCTMPDCPAGSTLCDLGENADGIYRACCGVCGNDHESITLLFDDGELVIQ